MFLRRLSLSISSWYPRAEDTREVAISLDAIGRGKKVRSGNAQVTEDRWWALLVHLLYERGWRLEISLHLIAADV